jgi:hypothetical protein
MPDADLLYLYDQYQKKFKIQHRYRNRWQWWGEAQSSRKNSLDYEEISPIRVDVGTGIEYFIEEEEAADQVGEQFMATDESILAPNRI